MSDIPGVTDAARFAELLAVDEDLRRMVAGDWMRWRTSPGAQEITRGGLRVCAEISRLYATDPDEAMRIFHAFVPGAGEGVDFRPPLTIDYGVRLVIGDRTFINADFMVIGGGLVTIGEDCLIGPRCAIYTPNHAEDLPRRHAGWERPLPVTIGNSVWLGGSVTLMPGVTIGDGSIIGAGSVVTRDVPAGVVAVGNPCRVVRPIGESDAPLEG